MLSIYPLLGVGEVRPGEDLAALLGATLRAADLETVAGDVLVVTSKIVSKAENRFVEFDDVVPGEEACALAMKVGKDARLVELALRESSAVVRAAPGVLITRHRLGLVMANAGIDRSNLGPYGQERALLLPIDPDASAARLREALANRSGAAPAIILSDSFGRPWRSGVVNVAIGVSGLPALLDRRGERDRDGRMLEVTQVALADMIASAAGLVCGEGDEGLPAALVRGLAWSADEGSAGDLVRPLHEDLFR